MEIFEIIVAVLAAFGLYSVLDMVRFQLMFPGHIRKNVRAAVVFDENSYRETVAYVNYLRREQKISSERLIIVGKDGIIINKAMPAEESAQCNEKCKDNSDDAGYKDGQEGA